MYFYIKFNFYVQFNLLGQSQIIDEEKVSRSTHNSVVNLEQRQLRRYKTQLKSKPNLYIYYAGGIGRLGNLMFEYASALGIARHNNRSIVFRSTSKLVRLKKLLPTLHLNTKKNNFLKDSKQIKEKHANMFDRRFFTLPETNVTIDGYLQSYKYFESISEEIFETFSKINPTVLNAVERLREKLKKEATSLFPQNVTTVCVHVRRGDILKMNHYAVVEPEELHFAMNWMERRHEKVIFYVASNDLQWTSTHLKKKNVFFSCATSAEEDFVLMQSCDHMIMTVGSFGWWAAWMTSQRGGNVMAYGNPYKPLSPLSIGCDRTSYFLPHWWSYQKQSVIQFKDVFRKNILEN